MNDSIANALIQFLPLLVVILGAPLVIGLTLLVKRQLNRWGISDTAAIEALVNGVVQQGVAYAEQEAARKAAEGDLADSGTKMEMATLFILAQLKALGLAEMARDELVRRIESAVGDLNAAV
jgi:hypothetical protein